MKYLSIVPILLTAVVLGQSGARKPGARQQDVPVEAAQTGMPSRWSAILIATAVVYCLLMLVGLYATGWFQVR
ncbi:MAG TPA: hypothetical protein VKU01_05260 [Bryobacteraceae bacterium]|nr:hypothetical protein [Bryobacteraceae bacterium]